MEAGYSFATLDHGVSGRGDAPNPKEAVFEFPEHGVAHVDRYNQLQSLSLTGLYGIGDRLAVGASIPVVFNLHQHVNRSIPEVAGGQQTPSEQSTSGLGDISLLGRYVAPLGAPGPRRPSLYALARVGLPTGKATLVDGSGHGIEPLIQPGAGAVGLGAVVGYFQPLHRYARAFGGVRYQYSFEANGFRRPPALGVDAGGALTGIGRVEVPVRVGYAHAFPAGAGSGDVANSGGDFVFLGPGLRLFPTDRVALTAEILVPVYYNVEGQQLLSDRIFNLAVSALY